MNLNRFKQLLESQMGNVKPLISEQSTTGTTTGQTTNLKPNSNNPLCNDMTGTFGSGSKTEFKTCVYKWGPSFFIDLRDSQGNILFSDGGSTFADALKTYFSRATKSYPDKKVGIDLPMPVDPDNESTSKYYKLGK